MHRLVPLLLLALSACNSNDPASSNGPVSTSPDAPESSTSQYESGAPHEDFQFYLDEGREIKHGTYRAFYESGPLQIQGFYKEGHKDSVWTHFDEGGRTKLVHTWRAGQKWDGAFQLFWPNGNSSEYGTYRQGQWHGAYVSYYSSGKTETSARYVEHERHGAYLELYESGGRKVQGTYWRGFKDGLWIHYSEAGIELQREEYDRGNIENTDRFELDTFDDGSIKSVTPYRDDQIHGVYVKYWPNGKKSEETTYYDGLKDGANFLYWDNGQIREQGHYQRGRKHGLSQTFSNSGTLLASLPYQRGRLSGYYVSYHTNGNMQWEGTYDGGLKDGVWTNYFRNGEKRLQQIWEEHELTSVIDCTEDDCQ